MKSDLSLIAAICLRAAELVEMGHCKGQLALSADGEPCDQHNPNAVAWCALGALLRAEREYDSPTIPGYCDMVDRLGRPLPAWNDAPERTAAEVAALFREEAFRA